MSGVADDYSANVARLFHGIVDQNVAGIYLAQHGVLRYVNNQFAEFFATSPRRLMNRPLADIAPAHQRESLVDQYQRRLSGERVPHFVIRTRLRDGSTRLIELHGSRVDYRGTPAVVGVAIDVTDRETTHAELVESRAQLRQLISTIETIQDTERARIARELHDDIGGLLTALKFDIARLRKRLDGTREQRSPSVIDDELLTLAIGINEIAQEAITSVRRISEELRPSVIGDLGLYAAIEDQVERFAARYEIEVSLTLPAAKSRVGPAAELDLFRMIQEALTNVARHADANTVTVDLHRDADTLRVTVEDDGRGYPTGGETPGLGLVGLRERVRRLGGSVVIDNGPAGGARIDARLPWRFED